MFSPSLEGVEPSYKALKAPAEPFSFRPAVWLDFEDTLFDESEEDLVRFLRIL